MESLNPHNLPEPPSHVAYDDIVIVFSYYTEGFEPKGFVPGYRFGIINSTGVEVGHISFRIGETDHVVAVAGHIGFNIKESRRGHRYAAKACMALGPFVAEISKSVIITADPDNIPSLRTIERIGAQFIDEVDVPEHDAHYERGSRRKRRYRWAPAPSLEDESKR